MIEAPEFHTDPSTPISPQPVHPPEPANVKVLRNQNDPVFNMTSTHIPPTSLEPSSATLPVDAPLENHPDSNDADFDDAYTRVEADPQDAQSQSLPVTQPDDDYAMTFDSDTELQPGSKPNSTEPYSPTLDAQQLPPPSPSSNNPSTLPPSSIPPISIAEGDSTNLALNSSLLPTPQPTDTVKDPQPSHGEVDIQQLLDDITANAERQRSLDNASIPQKATTSPATLTNPSLFSTLPPRPPIAQLPPGHLAYQTAQNPLSYGGNVRSLPPPPGLEDVYTAASTAVPSLASGAPGTVIDARGSLPPPPSTAQFYQSPSVGSQSAHLPLQSRPPQAPPSNGRDGKHNDRLPIDGPDYGEVVLNPVMQKLFNDFLDDEREYTADGQWDKFPVGSRLFVGNVPHEKVTKKDIFSQFQRYGRLAQISIKQAYGFVQFLEAAACQRALVGEQDQFIRGRRMHLEISKPSKNSRQGAVQQANDSRQRSRQEDYDRIDRGVDRGVNRNSTGPARAGYSDPYDRRDSRDMDNRGIKRSRDEYRGTYRSPSPPFRNDRGYNDMNRGKDVYRGRDTYPQRRTRSPTPPYQRRDSGRYGRRSPSPRRSERDVDDLPIPRRDPRDVPDVFIVLIDDLNRDFVSWVDSELRSRGLKTEIMHLNLRIPLEKVIQRQVVEGVHAVVLLTRSSEDASRVPLRVFDRSNGANNVRYDEYQDLEPKIAAELVRRVMPQSNTYTQPARSAPPAQSTTASAQNLIGNLDNAALQQLLGTLIPNGQTPQPRPAAAQSSVDLASILGGLQQPQSYQAPPQQPPSNGYHGQSAPQYGAPPQMQQPQSQQHIQDIMAQLAKFKK